MARIVVSAFVSDRHLALALAVGAALIVNESGGAGWSGILTKWRCEALLALARLSSRASFRNLRFTLI
jgi:hypothetical protein